MIFKTPMVIPSATPKARLSFKALERKAPLVRSSTVEAKAFTAGSARVAPNPSIHANIPMTKMPPVKPKSGEFSTCGCCVIHASPA